MTTLTINNRIIIDGAPKHIIDKITEDLTIPNPKHEEAERLGYSTWGINRYIRNFDFINYKSIAIHRGRRNYLISLLQKNRIDYSVIDNRSTPPQIPNLIESDISLRSYQMDYLKKLLSSGFEEGIIISPAGSGKTVMGLVITSVIGLPVLWLTHTNTLFKQTINRAENIIPFLKNGNISTIKGSKWNYDKPFTIGMVQTMIRNPEKVESISNEFGVVILDEAHHCPAKTFTDVISLLNPKYLFGLTATPNRADRLETLMYDVIGPVLIDIPINRIVDDGGIILPTVIYKEIETKKINDNNTNRLLKYLVNHKKRNNTIVSDIVQEAMNQEICIALSTRKEHCEILYTLTKLSWEKTGIATGDYSLKENEKTIQDLEEGKITVIFTTPDLLGEGFDVDILSRAFICLPFRSETRVEQLIGRAQRYHKDKKNVNIYDYVDTSIGVFKDQFFSPNKNKHCRYRVYERLGLSVVPG